MLRRQHRPESIVNFYTSPSEIPQKSISYEARREYRDKFSAKSIQSRLRRQAETIAGSGTIFPTAGYHCDNEPGLNTYRITESASKASSCIRFPLPFRCTKRKDAYLSLSLGRYHSDTRASSPVPAASQIDIVMHVLHCDTCLISICIIPICCNWLNQTEQQSIRRWGNETRSSNHDDLVGICHYRLRQERRNT